MKLIGKTEITPPPNLPEPTVEKPVKIRTKINNEKMEIPNHIKLLLKDLFLWILSLSKKWTTKRLIVHILMDYFNIQ